MIIAATAAHAQDVPPPPIPAPPIPTAGGTVTPSGDMDFNVQPILSPAERPQGAAEGSNDPVQNFERFFSSEPVLPDAPKPEPLAPTVTEDTATPLPPPPVIKKAVRKAPPPFNPKSIVLPSTIYTTKYSKNNRHLPRAVYIETLKGQVPPQIDRRNINGLRALQTRDIAMGQFSPNGDPALLLPVRNRDIQTAKWLLTQGVAINQMDRYGHTALHAAVFNGDPAMVDLLLSFGANTNVADYNGVTPLMFAARRGAPVITRQLLEHGAYANATSHAGDTALHYASSMGNQEVHDLLVSAGADMYATNELGFTPDELAQF